MPTAKENVRKLLDQMPDDASFAEIRYNIPVMAKVERAIEQVDSGQVLSHDEVVRRAHKWLRE